MLGIKLIPFCFSPARFLCCAERSTLAAFYNHSPCLYSFLSLFLSGEQPDQDGCDPTPRIAPFAMEMRTGRLLAMCSSELLLRRMSWRWGTGQRRCAREIHLEQTRIFLDTSESLHFFLKSLIGNQKTKCPFHQMVKMREIKQ